MKLIVIHVYIICWWVFNGQVYVVINVCSNDNWYTTFRECKDYCTCITVSYNKNDMYAYYLNVLTNVWSFPITNITFMHCINV